MDANKKPTTPAPAEDLFDRMKSDNPGDSDKIARSYFDSFLIDLRYIDSGTPNMQTELFGHTFDSPLSITALSHLTKFGYGERAMELVAQAAKELNILNFCGSGSEDELDRVVSTGAKTVKIIKPFQDFEIIYRKMEHARRIGAVAVGMDVDHAIKRDGTYTESENQPLCPKSLEDLKTIIQASKLPFIIKGVLSVSDAQKCVEAGAGGIYVSNHHGQIPFMPPPLMVLPEITKVVAGKMPIFVDSGIESGYDAFKAMALGATAVGVGRPLIKLVKAEGSEGVKRWLQKATKELCGLMAYSGIHDVSGFDPTHLLRKS